MNWIDIMFLTILGGALLWGMLRGIVAQLISLLSLILGGALAVLFYPDLAALLARVLDGLSRQGRETVAFLLLLIAVFNIIHYTLRSSIIPPEERRREAGRPPSGLEAALASGVHRFILAPLYMLVSMTLAAILTCTWFAILAGLLRHSLAVPWPAYDGIRAFLHMGLGSSTVVTLLDGAFDEAYAAVAGWLFQEPASPLTGVLRRVNRLPWML